MYLRTLDVLDVVNTFVNHYILDVSTYCWVDVLCNYKHPEDGQLRPKHVGAVKWNNIYLFVHCVSYFPLTCFMCLTNLHDQPVEKHSHTTLPTQQESPQNISGESPFLDSLSFFLCTTRIFVDKQNEYNPCGVPFISLTWTFLLTV
jgi:hypothetical protein